MTELKIGQLRDDGDGGDDQEEKPRLVIVSLLALAGIECMHVCMHALAVH